VASVDLLFAGTPLTRGDLVFGDDGSNPVRDAAITGAITLVKPTMRGMAALGLRATGAITTAKPSMSGGVRYNTDTQRPLTSVLRAPFQEALQSQAGVESLMQQAQPLPAGVAARFTDADGLQTSTTTRMQDGLKTPISAGVRFQDGNGVGSQVSGRFQDATKAPRYLKARFQDALRQHGTITGIRFQDASRMRNSAAAIFQDGRAFFAGVEENEGYGRPIEVGFTSRYQNGIKPSAGRPPPIVPPVDPCYIPSPDLLFAAPWSADTNLVFICERHPPVDPGTGETVVVPVKRVYVVLNDVSLRRVDGDIPLPTFRMSMSLDVDSWTWSFQASLPTFALSSITPNSNGDPVELEASINGVPYRLLAESLSRDRSFGQESLSISGRGLAATLDAPYAPVLNFGNTGDRTAQQLMADVLSLNGVPLPDWSVDWQMEDWTVPGGIWTQQGSYIDGLKSIVEASGGYLQPVPSAKTVRALLRYPTAPWDWGDVTPDFEIPSAVATREGIEWVEKARYNRVFVSGIGAGVNGQVTRAGTAGDLVAPQITDSLILSAVPARRRGVAVLADTGRIATVSLRMPVLAETGVIPPGKFIRYVDAGVTRIGLTRSVSLDVGLPEVFQTIGIETHEYA